MQYLRNKLFILLSIITGIPLLVGAIMVFHILFYEFKEDIPTVDDDAYYYIPEAELYVKTEGATFRMSKHLVYLKSHQGHSTDFRVMNDSYPSTIFYPLENNRNNRVFVSDPHNSLILLQKSGSVIWTAEKQIGFVLPKSVEILLPIRYHILNYRLPDDSIRCAEIVDKETICEVEDFDTCGCDYLSLDLLSGGFSQETIDDAKLHITKHGAITLHLRDNWIVCGKQNDYPVFFYNPRYPHYLYCSEENSCIMFKKCDDIQLIETYLTKGDIQKSGLDNWYIIHLDPFKFESLVFCNI